MSDAGIHVFNHSAMATQFQVRIAGEEKTYAAQTAQAAFAPDAVLRSPLTSRLAFRGHEQIGAVALGFCGLAIILSGAGQCIGAKHLTQRLEFATRGAFSVTASALRNQPTKPLWALVEKEFSIRCDSGRLEFDLGAIGKGFALDRMAAVLREWSCPAFLLVAGGSSILAGDAPAGTVGWDCGLGENNSSRRHRLVNGSLSGSGLAVKGEHIFDPRTGLPCSRRNRAWALASTAAESDALSTACMILNETEILEVLKRNADWLVFLNEKETWRQLGSRPAPPLV